MANKNSKIHTIVSKEHQVHEAKKNVDHVYGQFLINGKQYISQTHSKIPYTQTF